MNFRGIKSDVAVFLFENGVTHQALEESYIAHDAQYRELLRKSRSEQMRELARTDQISDDFFVRSELRIPELLSNHPEVRDTAIDIGCGVGTASVKLAQFFKKVIAIEPSEAAIKLARKRNNASVKWRVGLAEDELKKLKLSKPALFYSSVVLSHIDDETVMEICYQINEVAPFGSILCLAENWGSESHQKLWHTRTPKWWVDRLHGWDLSFLPASIQGRGDRYRGIHGYLGNGWKAKI